MKVDYQPHIAISEPTDLRLVAVRGNRGAGGRLFANGVFDETIQELKSRKWYLAMKMLSTGYRHQLN